MNDLKYWEDKWIKIGKDYIFNKQTTEETIKFWNKTSIDYDERVDNSRVDIINKLKGKYINEDSLVLDLGCGTGTYSIELSKICKEVHAMDFSDGMLDILNKKIHKENIKNIKVIKEDWNNINTKDNTYYKKYDFVLSSLNPGCYNPSSLMKMNNVSKDWCCYIATDGKSKSELLSKADKMILGKNIPKCDISNVIYPFNILYYNGLNPIIFYETCNWIEKYTYEEAINKLKNRYKDLIEINEEIDEKIISFIDSNMKDGIFRYKVENTLGGLIWKSKITK